MNALLVIKFFGEAVSLPSAAAPGDDCPFLPIQLGHCPGYATVDTNTTRDVCCRCATTTGSEHDCDNLSSQQRRHRRGTMTGRLFRGKTYSTRRYINNISPCSCLLISHTRMHFPVGWATQAKDTVNNIRISTDILWRVFRVLTEPMTYTSVSVNRRNNEVRAAHTAMWVHTTLFRRFTDTNVYETGYAKIWKTRHKISVNIRIFLQGNEVDNSHFW